MRLYSLQTTAVVETLQEQGLYYADWEKVMWPRQRGAYEWMAAQMAARGIAAGAAPPIWAWHSCGGWEQPPRQQDIDALLGIGWALEGWWHWLALEVPANQALLSSYHWWGLRFYEQDPADFGLDDAQLAALTFDLHAPDFEIDQIQASLPVLRLEWMIECRLLAEVYSTLD